MWYNSLNSLQYVGVHKTKNSNIYLLEISKLSKKEEILFYEFDDRLKELNSDFIITIKNKEIISIITFNTSYLNSIVDSISRGE